MKFLKIPVYAFANDDELVQTAEIVEKEVLGKDFVLKGDELFLFGDNAYIYFSKTRGLFTVFLTGISGENHPLHHPKYQITSRNLNE